MQSEFLKFTATFTCVTNSSNVINVALKNDNSFFPQKHKVYVYIKHKSGFWGEKITFIYNCKIMFSACILPSNHFCLINLLLWLCLK